MTLTSSLDSPRRRHPDLRTLLVAGLIGLSLAGCKTNRHEIVGAIPDDYRTNHPIVIGEKLTTLDVPVGPETPRLTTAMESNIRAFADGFLRSGSKAIAIVTPTGSGNERAAQAMARQLASVLQGAGIPARKIDYRHYAAEPIESQSPVRLAYAHVRPQTRPCGAWEDQVSQSSENRHYEAFGCATQQNLAAMVDNPMDLLYPRQTSTADGTRRTNVLERYRNGEPTQTDLSREPGSELAEGVGE
jgi:pilus assembly protein CpaD